MNLVKGALRDTTVSSSHVSKSRPRHMSRTIRPSDLGHSAGAYARMDEEGHTTGAIKLRDLRSGEISKTTTTEVRIEEMEGEKEEDMYGEGARKDEADSRGSSEVYVIQQQGKQIV